MSASCVVGIAAGNARRARRVCVACSYANAKLIRENSENAVPRKDSPMGTPGAGYTVNGPAEPGMTVWLSG